ncbi:MAG: class I SAM-dependent methyltransferase [Lewinellaceae bacterium]|nr:class I SAM-dependent methyltransferase [Lewinellaceae bacterium]
MENTPFPSFDPVLDDYNFFMAHSDEAEKDLQAYAKYLPGSEDAKQVFRMLDFGAGAGAFSANFLRMAGWAADRLALTLVEPGETARLEAAQRLGAFTKHPITHFASLPDAVDEPFDLILSNHALYFVPDLAATVRFFTNHCKAGGKCLLAMSGKENALIQCWARGFQAIGAPIPYFTGDDLFELLQAQQVPFHREKVDFSIDFPDSTENRMKILRFLFGPQLPLFPESVLLDFFEPYRSKGHIRIDTGHYIYVTG